MEIWHFFMEKLTLESKKGTKGLKYDDAYICCRIAEMEGQFDELLKHGGTPSNQWSGIRASDIQGRMRDLFRAVFPDEPLPDKLQMGYKPRGSMSD